MLLARIGMILLATIVGSGAIEAQIGGGGGGCSGCELTRTGTVMVQDSTGTLLATSIGFDGLCRGGATCKGYACELLAKAIFSPSDPLACGELETCVITGPFGKRNCEDSTTTLCSAAESHVADEFIECDGSKSVAFTVGSLQAGVTGLCTGCDPN